MEFYSKREKVPILRIPYTTCCEEEVPDSIMDNDRTSGKEGEATRFESDILSSDSIRLRDDGAFERILILESDNHNKSN